MDPLTVDDKTLTMENKAVARHVWSLSCFNHTGYGTLSVAFCKACSPSWDTLPLDHLGLNTPAQTSIGVHLYLYEMPIAATPLSLHRCYINTFYDGLSSLPEGSLLWSGAGWLVTPHTLGSYSLHEK